MSDKIKEIEHKLQTVTDPREKVDLLNDLSWELRLSDPQRGLEAAVQANKLSKELAYAKGLANSSCCMGTNYYFLSAFNKSIMELEKAVNNYLKINDIDGQATALNWMGNSYHRLGDYPKALQYHLESMQLRKKLDDLNGEASSLNNIGNIYLALGDYDNCLEYYFKTLHIVENLENNYGISISMNNIGEVYGALGDYKNALDFLLKSHKIAQEIGNRHVEMISLDSIGGICFKQKQYDAALDYYMKGLSISEELGEYVIRVGLLRGIGSVYQKIGKNESAFEHYLKGLNISHEVGNKENEQSVLLNLGKLYGQIGKTEEGFKYLHQSLSIAEELKSKPKLSESYKELSDVYRQRGDYQEALDYFQKYHEANKELFNENSDKKRQSMMIRFQVEQTEKEAEIYRLKNVDLLEANQTIQKDKEIIEEKNKHITSSIEYAKRIQQAVLPTTEKMASVIPEHFVIFKPKDIVSGDFYWFSQMDDKLLIAVVDCTGHGVPGAFMSMIGSMLLNVIVNENRITDPALILENMHKEVRFALKQEGVDAESNDGMDVCLCSIDRKNNKLTFAGAKRPLYMVRDSQLTEIAGDGKSIGGRQKEEKRSFTDNEIDVKKGDMIYLSSDGFADQCNAEGLKFGTRKLKEIFTTIANQNHKQQRNALLSELDNHQWPEEQRDDIALMGVRF